MTLKQELGGKGNTVWDLVSAVMILRVIGC